MQPLLWDLQKCHLPALGSRAAILNLMPLVTDAAALTLSPAVWLLFTRPGSLGSFSHVVSKDLCAAMGVLCVMLVSIMFLDEDFQKGIPQTVTIADVNRICHYLTSSAVRPGNKDYLVQPSKLGRVLKVTVLPRGEGSHK